MNQQITCQTKALCVGRRRIPIQISFFFFFLEAILKELLTAILPRPLLQPSHGRRPQPSQVPTCNCMSWIDINVRLSGCILTCVKSLIPSVCVHIYRIARIRRAFLRGCQAHQLADITCICACANLNNIICFYFAFE